LTQGEGLRTSLAYTVHMIWVVLAMVEPREALLEKKWLIAA